MKCSSNYLSHVLLALLLVLPYAAFAWCSAMGGYSSYEAMYAAQREERESARQGIREEQTALQTLGYYKGSIDGFTGPKMQKAVSEFRFAQGLKPTTTLTSEDRVLLVSGKAKSKAKTMEETKEAQQMLKDLGYYKGTPDGVLGPQTQTALVRFREANNLLQDGLALDETTLTTLRDAHSKLPLKTNSTEVKDNIEQTGTNQD